LKLSLTDTIDTMFPAMKYGLKNGFKQIHIRKNYYGSDSALILVKEI